MKLRIDENYYNGIYSHYDGSDPEDLMKNQKEIAVIDDENASTDSTYSSAKIEELITVGGFEIKVVDVLPTVGESGVLYLVPSQTRAEDNIHDEYIWVDNNWELIGSTGVDLSNYYTTGQTNALLSNYYTTGQTYSTTQTNNLLSQKQNTISDLQTIRNGAASGATALQSVPAQYITDTALTEALSVYYTTAQTDEIMDELEYVVSSHINELTGKVNGKQDVLTAGDGIEISGNTISCTAGGAEGYTFDSALTSFAIGSGTTAGGLFSFVQGSGTTASNKYAVAEGFHTTASGESAHAEGLGCIANGAAAHAEGSGTTALNATEHAEGQNNVSHTGSTTYGHSGNTQHSVGIGTTDNDRKNAFEIMQNGDAYMYGVGNYSGTTIKSAGNNVETVQDVINSKVSSTNIFNILKLTQTEYDNLQTKDPNTFYIIVEPPVTIPTFTLTDAEETEGEQYQFEAGMTWADWIESEYYVNPPQPLEVHDGEIRGDQVVDDIYYYVFNERDHLPVSADAEIEENGEYYMEVNY